MPELQEYAVLIAGLSAGAFGGVLTCWCAWLEYRVVMREKLAKRLVPAPDSEQPAAAVVEEGQLVFDMTSPRERTDVEAGVWDHRDASDGGGGVWVGSA